uniref:Uncharacterized protein n=1 Tax=Rhizophora mucronata TaxID=61149 RepID=A0A2P2PH84_RHIMU
MMGLDIIWNLVTSVNCEFNSL